MFARTALESVLMVLNDGKWNSFKARSVDVKDNSECHRDEERKRAESRHRWYSKEEQNRADWHPPPPDECDADACGETAYHVSLEFCSFMCSSHARAERGTVCYDRKTHQSPFLRQEASMH